MNHMAFGTVQPCGLVQRKSSLLASPLGFERIRTRGWHDRIVEIVARDSSDARGTAPRWFREEVIPWIEATTRRWRNPVREALWLRYIEDLERETEAYVSFLLSGTQVFQAAVGLQQRQDFLDIDRPLVTACVLPYPAFFLVLESHPAFAIWDDRRSPEFIDGCFVTQCPDGSLDLHFTVRGANGASGLPGIGVSVPATVAAPTSVRGCVLESVRRRQPMPEASAPVPTSVRMYRSPYDPVPTLTRQTAARENALCYATNLVLKMLGLFETLPRQRAGSNSRIAKLGHQVALIQAGIRKAPELPRAVGLTLKPVPSGTAGLNHHRVSDSPAAHWRRAHWRRQPCGPGNSQRKTVRISPSKIGEPQSATPRS